MKSNNPKYPCKGCVYFKTCGSSTRTHPCNGRQLKSERKKNNARYYPTA